MTSIAAVSTLLLLPLPALAGLEFCNNSDETVSIAIGCFDGGTWASEGWWPAEPGASNATASRIELFVAGTMRPLSFRREN